MAEHTTGTREELLAARPPMPAAPGQRGPTGGERLQEARRYVRRKRIFYTVVGIWIALSLMWFTIDMLDDGTESLWFYWPMLGTGIAVAITGIVLLGIGGIFGADWEQRQIDKYLRSRGEGPGG
jgi:hypothetical protein